MMPVVIGREGELALLELLLSRAAQQRRAALATIVGPPGIGKSLLAQEFCASIQTRGLARVVHGKSLPYGEGLTYWPLAEIVRADAGILDTDPDDQVRQKAESLFARTFPGETSTGSVLLASIGVPVWPDPLEGAEPGPARELIQRAWQSYLSAIAAEDPVLVVLEDVHWADEGMLDLIGAVAERAEAPILLLCLARPDLLERRPTWGGGSLAAMNLPLTPLTGDESERLLGELLDGAAAPVDVLRAIAARSEGNPFFARELFHMVTDSGALTRRDDVWVLERPLPEDLPATVNDVITSRLDLLSPEDHRVLEDAAIVGRLFWEGAVAALGAPAVHSALERLAARGLVAAQATSVVAGDREFAFTHVLIKDAAEAQIPADRRADAHARALAWMEATMGDRTEEFAEILAYHAERAGDALATARYATLAGHRSRRVFAAAEAARWYDRAIEAAGRAGAQADGLAGEAHVARGSAREQLGSFADAQADYEVAIDVARAAGDAPLEARALAALSHVFWLEDRFDDGERVLGHALDHARAAGANDLLASLLYTAGTLAFGRGRYHEALIHHGEALAVAQAAGDLAGEAMARHGLCETRFFLGPFAASLDEGRRADALFRQLGQGPMIHHNLYMVGWALWLRGDIAGSFAAFDESVQGCRELGNRRDEAFALSRAMSHLSQGDLGGMIADPTRAIEIAAEIHTPRVELAQRSLRSHAWAELGMLDRLEEDLGVARAISNELGGSFYRPRTFAWEGFLAVRAGDVARARALFEEGLREAGDAELDIVWNSWIELLAVEDSGGPEELRAAAAHLADGAGEDGPGFAEWSTYGRSLADARERAWDAACTGAGSVVPGASVRGDRMLEWRALTLEADALSALGRAHASALSRMRAGELVAAIAATARNAEERDAFLARPLVMAASAEVPGWFADLSVETLASLLSAADVHDAEAGGWVVSGVEAAQRVFAVDRGAIRLEAGGVVVGRAASGETFGEEALAGLTPVADAVAEGTVRVFSWPAERVAEALASSSRAADRMLGALGRRLEVHPDLARERPDVSRAWMRSIEHLAQRGRGDGMVEVFPVLLEDGTFRWLRPAGAHSPLHLASGEGHPGDAALHELRSRGLAPLAVHSTSWRTEGDRVVLTYLAVLDERAANGWDIDDVTRTELARGSATGAPARIEVAHVIEHGLRHLSWLMRDDPVIRDLLSDAWKRALGGYTPEPFRALGGSFAGRGEGPT